MAAASFAVVMFVPSVSAMLSPFVALMALLTARAKLEGMSPPYDTAAPPEYRR